MVVDCEVADLRRFDCAAVRMLIKKNNQIEQRSNRCRKPFRLRIERIRGRRIGSRLDPLPSPPSKTKCVHLLP